MANNWVDLSSAFPLEEGQKDLAKFIIARVSQELEDDENEGYAGFSASIEEDDDGKPCVWVRGDESAAPEHVEILFRALVDEFMTAQPVVVEFSYNCSKPRVGQFGGGAFALAYGYDTVWVDAGHEARRSLEDKMRKQTGVDHG